MCSDLFKLWSVLKCYGHKYLIKNLTWKMVKQNDHKEQSLLVVWRQTDAVRFGRHSAWFIPLMVSDIYSSWPAKLHISCPINIFVAPGIVQYITAGRGGTVRFLCCNCIAWLLCSKRNLIWIERTNLLIMWLVSLLICLHSFKSHLNASN